MRDVTRVSAETGADLRRPAGSATATGGATRGYAGLPASLLMLQRCAGNRAVTAALGQRRDACDGNGVAQRQPVGMAPQAPVPATAPPAGGPAVAGTGAASADPTLDSDVNGYADTCLDARRRAFSNAVNGFRNWYFEQDEGTDPLFVDLKRVVAEAGGTPRGPFEAALQGPFREASERVATNRTGFLTSLVQVITAFGDADQRDLRGRAVERLAADPHWSDVQSAHREAGDWRAVLHVAGLPPVSSDLAQRLLADLIFAYRKWELAQHTAAYRGIYSMVDPDLRHMQASAAAEATRRLRSPSMDYGDVVVPLGDHELLATQPISIEEGPTTAGTTLVRLPLTEGVGLGVNLTAGWRGGFRANGSFGPVRIEHLRLGLSYGQVAAMFGLWAGLVATGGVAALPIIAAIAGARLRATGMLTVPARVHATLDLEALLRLALDVGASADLSVDLASIEGRLGADAAGDFQARFQQPVDIIADHRQISFVSSGQLSLSHALSFGLHGEVAARILTVGWSKRWDLAKWQSGTTWSATPELNLVYVNGIQGDRSRLVSFTTLRNVLAQIPSLSNQMMHFSGAGAPPPTGVPAPSGRLDLDWPKPVAANYPRLYITTRGETRSQRELKQAYRQGAPHIRVYSPLTIRQLPHGGQPIGLGEFSKLGPDNNIVGPLVPGATPGGYLINDIVRDYGVVPSEMNGDHVRDMQVGGENDLRNLWPLEARFNSNAGTRLQIASATDPTTTPPQVIPLATLKSVVAAHPGAAYFFRLVSFDSTDFR